MQAINEKIMALWENSSAEQTNGLMPFFYSELKSNSIVFVGLNPSFSEQGIKRFLANTGYQELDIKKFYAHPNSGEFKQEVSVQIEQIAQDKYPYFKKFKDISNSTDQLWEHVDLFFIRETSQKNMKKKIFEQGTTLNKFGREQLNLSKSIIETAEPKIIVVANALAGQIFKKEFKSKFNESKGCHYVNLNNKNIPVFLCSMLTGQRALDNFSYERLKWHINKIITE